MLPRLRRVIATSQPVAERLQTEFGVAASTVPPGAGTCRAPSQPIRTTPVVLAVGVLTRRKGHDLLLRADARLTDLPWRLVIAGDAGREPAHARRTGRARRRARAGAPDHAARRPGPGRARTCMGAATVFALATRWEGYASAVAEALRRGIPSW